MSGFDSDDAHIGRVAHLRQGNRYTFHIQFVPMYRLIVVAHTDVGYGRVGGVWELISILGRGVRFDSTHGSTKFQLLFFCFLWFFCLEQVLTRVTSLYELAHAFPRPI